MRKWLKIIGLAMLLSLLFWTLNSFVGYILGEGSFFKTFFMPDMHHFWIRLPVVVLSVPIVYVVSRLLELRREVKILEGLIPICAWCKKKIRDDNGEWQDVDHYISMRGKVEFTHGLCPECYNKLIAEEDSKHNNNVNDS